VDDGQRQRAQPQRRRVRRGRCAGRQPAGFGQPGGEKPAHAGARQPPQHELEHRRRIRVQPLRVVHRDQQRALRAQPHQQRADRGGQRPRVRAVPGGVGAQQRHLERAALRRRQPGVPLPLDRLEQVRQSGQGEFGFRFGRPAGQHPESAGVRPPDDLTPYRGLAGAGFPEHPQHAEPLANFLEKRISAGQFIFSPEYRAR
jgi:hypothetical protein